MKKFLSIVLMILLVLSPVMMVEAKTTKATTTAAAKKTTTKKNSKSTTATTTKETESDKDPIKVHVFYSNTCEYCKALHAFLDELKKDKTYGKMFEVVDYEISDAGNNDIMYEVVSYFEKEYKGVPIYVIGDEYMSGYSAENSDEDIKRAIKNAYNLQTEDKVQKVIDKIMSKGDNNVLGYIILVVVAIIIVGVIISSCVTGKYDEDEVDAVEASTESESETKEVVEEKPATKSSATKKTKASQATKKKSSNSTKKSK